MKRTLSLSLLLCLFAFAGSTLLFAQDQPQTKDEWQKQMTEWTAKRDAAKTQLDNLNKDITDLKAQSKKLDEDITAAEDKLFQMYGMTRAEVEAFDKELAKYEALIQELMHVSDEELLKHKDEVLNTQKRVDEMAAMKVAKLPRFANRISTLQNNIATLIGNAKQFASAEKTYVVGTWAKNHDCLWNIAKKPDIYANAWMWPKIWQGNRDQIKNPDVIHPKQKLKIPAGKELTKEEKSAVNKYYRRKAGK